MAAPTPVQRTVFETERLICRKITIPTGGDTDLTTTNILDISTFTAGTTGTSVALMKVMWSLNGFSATILDDASTDVDMITLAPGTGMLDFTQFSDNGIGVSTAASGSTGDLFLATNGLAATDDDDDDSAGFILLLARKVA